MHFNIATTPQQNINYANIVLFVGLAFYFSKIHVNQLRFHMVVIINQTTVYPCSLGGGIVMGNSPLKRSQDTLQADTNDPYSYGGRINMANPSSKSLQGVTQLNASKGAGSSSISTNLQRNHYIGGWSNTSWIILRCCCS